MLENKGYRFHQTRLYAIQLTKPDLVERFQDTKAPYRHRLGGLSQSTVHKILLYSHSAQHAAQQIEDISLGNKLAADEPTQNAAQAIDESQIHRLAEAYAENIAAKRDNEAVQNLQSQLAAAMDKLEKIESSQAANNKKPAEKKKRGRPRSKAIEAGAELARKAASQGNVLANKAALDEDQEELLRQAMSKMKPSE